MKGVMNAESSSSYSADRRYVKWKSVIPTIYDWFTNHDLVWPSLACRWGRQIGETASKNKYRIYYGEQTDGSSPNTLIASDCELHKPKLATARQIAHFDEENRSPHVRRHKTIIHPGEVNRIREVPQKNNMVATQTDCPEVLIWDFDNQPARHAIPGAAESRPDLVLAGHVDNSEFALATTTFEPFVLSGGKDKSIILWNINDQPVLSKYRPITKFAGNRHFIAPRCFFHGHTDTIEDIEFSPTNAQEFCSVGDDSKLMFWDTRVGGRPVIQVENAHHVDIHSVSWNTHDTNLVLTGSADNAVQMFDRRYLFSDSHDRFPVCRFQGHDSAVFCVQWCPDKSSVFGSSADDGIVNIWDHEKVEGGSVSVDPNAAPDRSSAGLIFRHVGHRNKVVEFQWNSKEPWTIVSISDDCKGPGGGTLQIWRMMDIIYGGEENQEERIAELNRLRPCTVGRDPTSIKNLSLNFLN